MRGFWRGRFGRERPGADALPGLLLLLVVLIPTGCLLWFMNLARKNERLAFRQTLAEAYRSEVSRSAKRLSEYWNETGQRLETISKNGDAPTVFANAVRSGTADAIVLFDENGKCLYPNVPAVFATELPEFETQWAEAARLENLRRDLKQAAKAYELIAIGAANVNVTARARQAQARCLLQAGEKEGAIGVVTEILSQGQFRDVPDGQGRLIVANCELMVLELADKSSTVFRASLERLRARLNDYHNSVLASPQRRFLMKEVQRLAPADGQSEFPTLAAEELAIEYLNNQSPRPSKSVLEPTTLPNVFQFAAANGRVLALFRSDRLQAKLETRLNRENLAANATIHLVATGTEMERALLSVPAGPELPGWHLVVLLKDPKVFEVASQRRVAAYLWIGSLAVVVVSILSIFAMRVIRRQAALTRLKNDLVATVSHELKTPLASMRVLVDTLLDSRQLSEQTTREYLGLIASENERLSRMIENFLTFSRLERQRYNFHFAPWPAAAIVDSVVEICQPRLAVPGCQFEVQVEAGLPNVNADCDAMATALSNLLDNACKYSQEIKHIILRVRAAEGAILFEVEDNGIGIPSREVKRIFRDFYQVDQRLCRDGSGCGLGLSIVQSIVTAHGGSVRVSSEPGRGSKFSISIPVAAVTTETGRKAVA